MPRRNEPTLQRGLQNRRLPAIATGGAIGTRTVLGIGGDSNGGDRLFCWAMAFAGIYRFSHYAPVG